MKLSTAALSLSLLIGSSQACDLDTTFNSPCSYESFKAASGCSDTQISAELGSDAVETVNQLCYQAKDKLYEDFLPWSKVSSRGEQFTDTFFDGGSIFNTEDGVEKTGLKVEDHPDTQRIRDIKEQLLTSHGIGFPEYIKNFHSTDSCESRAAMCCWVASRDNANGETVGNTDVCHHKIEDSAGSAHVEKGSAVFGSLGEVKCDGFLWADGEPYKGNLLFKVAMENGLLSGNVRNVPGAPMCACLEQMPVVTHADCTDINVVETWASSYDNNLGTFTIEKHGDPVITFNDCGGDDLATYYATVNDDTDYPIQEQFVDSCDYEVAEALAEIAFKKRTQDWIPVAGKGLLYTPSLTSDEFNVTWQLSNNQILRRRCYECERPHMDIYYRRFDTNGLPDDLDLLHVVKSNWSVDIPSNDFNVDFKLYSSYQDALNDVNSWSYCGPNDDGKGFPGSCGPYGASSNQYNAFEPYGTTNGQDHIAFYVENGGQ